MGSIRVAATVRGGWMLCQLNPFTYLAKKNFQNILSLCLFGFGKMSAQRFVTSQQLCPEVALSHLCEREHNLSSLLLYSFSMFVANVEVHLIF